MTTDQAAQGLAAPAGYLLLHELGIRRTFYGVPVFWGGEDGDTALALTGDWRLGCAAAHALGRADLGGPVRSQVNGDQTTVRWTRFEPVEELDQDWEATPVPVGTEGAVQVVWVNELSGYKPGEDIAAHYEVPGVAGVTAQQPGSTGALYLDLVATHGECTCNSVACYGDIEDLAEDGCLLCLYLDVEWPCPAEEDADYPTTGGAS